MQPPSQQVIDMDDQFKHLELKASNLVQPVVEPQMPMPVSKVLDPVPPTDISGGQPQDPTPVEDLDPEFL